MCQLEGPRGCMYLWENLPNFDCNSKPSWFSKITQLHPIVGSDGFAKLAQVLKLYYTSCTSVMGICSKIVDFSVARQNVNQSLLAGVEYLVAFLPFLRLLGKVGDFVCHLWILYAFQVSSKDVNELQYVGLMRSLFLSRTPYKLCGIWQGL